jgi:hypothetical protein
VDAILADAVRQDAIVIVIVEIQGVTVVILWKYGMSNL